MFARLANLYHTAHDQYRTSIYEFSPLCDLQRLKLQILVMFIELMIKLQLPFRRGPSGDYQMLHKPANGTPAQTPLVSTYSDDYDS